ncbi:MAG: hypothetical protein EXX96DRAFT_617840 [Benjaminiella poitrasii]|nr:MAG: hypothetical protein EXX96DRAFT_617840 [Benjaminiella poitrasii]
MKCLMDLDDYVYFRSQVGNFSVPGKVTLITTTTNQTAQSSVLKTLPVRKAELLDFVIEFDMSARQAGFNVGITERSAQRFVKAYNDDSSAALEKSEMLLLVAFPEIEFISLSGLHKRLVNHTTLTLKKLDEFFCLKKLRETS